MRSRVIVAVGLAATLLATGCVGLNTFRTYYETPVSADVSRNWRVVDVNVTAPRTLSVSEGHTFLPNADIVWQEDPPGDRYKQIEDLIRTAALQGAKAARGSQPVRLDITVVRFHALTFQAESLRVDVGVHNVDFTIRAVDARTGALLAGPELVEAALPAMTGARMAEARARGQSQRTQISAHLRKVVAGWMGVGPDARGTFTRMGN